MLELAFCDCSEPANKDLCAPIVACYLHSPRNDSFGPFTEGFAFTRVSASCVHISESNFCQRGTPWGGRRNYV
jgi:hypothetical protein